MSDVILSFVMLSVAWLSVIMPSFILQNVTILIVVILKAIILNVVILSVTEHLLRRITNLQICLSSIRCDAICHRQATNWLAAAVEYSIEHQNVHHNSYESGKGGKAILAGYGNVMES
jgi:hypothetical protein